MSPHKIGLPAPYQTPEDRILHGLSVEQRQKAFWYELKGFGHLSFVADLLRRNDPLDQEIIRDWGAIWLIRNQGMLWAWGYNKEQRGKLQDVLETLRASGRYTLEFRLYDLCCGDD